MIGYVTLGTNDLEKAAAFYDALLGELGAKRMMETDSFIAWSTGPGTPAISCGFVAARHVSRKAERFLKSISDQLRSPWQEPLRCTGST